MTCPRCSLPCRSLLADSLLGPWNRCVECWYAENDASRMRKGDNP